MHTVEWRPQGKAFESQGAWRCQWVAYLDAAAIASLLDEWVGPLGWRDHYGEVLRDKDGKAAALWGCVEIRDPETAEWVAKNDVGTPSDMEAVKGLVSDAFKRAACLKWGVGRNVYDLPIVWATCDVFGEKNSPRAGKNTLSQILEECRKRGVDVEGGRVAGEGSPAPAGVDAPEAPITASSPGAGDSRPMTEGQRKALVHLMDKAGNVVPLDGFSYDDAAALLVELQKAKAA